MHVLVLTIELSYESLIFFARRFAENLQRINKFDFFFVRMLNYEQGNAFSWIRKGLRLTCVNDKQTLGENMVIILI